MSTSTSNDPIIAPDRECQNKRFLNLIWFLAILILRRLACRRSGKSWNFSDEPLRWTPAAWVGGIAPVWSTRN